MIPRRTIGEWITVANIARDIRTLFVEGVTDARLLSVAAGFPKEADIRSADELDYHADDRDRFIGGNKRKILELAYQAEGRLNHGNLRCLVDLDFGSLWRPTIRSEILFFTDYANLVVGCFSRNWLQSFLLRGYGAVVTDPVWERLCDGLTFAFFARYQAAMSNSGHRCPELSDFIAKDGLGPRLDRTGFLRSYHGLNRRDPRLIALEDTVVELREWAPFDIKFLINSNDLFSLLFGFLRQMGRITGATPKESVRAAALASLPHDLDNQETVSNILDWLEPR